MSGAPTDPIALQLREAMRTLASSVSIIAAADGAGQRNAITATSVTSLSMDPPAMLVCINRATSLYPYLDMGAGFSINVLTQDQLEIAQLCSSKAFGEERFVTGQWDKDATGTPYLRDAQAALLCKVEKRISHGTHDIVIGAVHSVHLSGACDPLIYVQGQYRHIAA